MTSHVHFVHLDKTEALENFAHQKIDPVLEKYLGEDEISHYVRLKMENPPRQSGVEVFHCEIDVQNKRLGRALHIHESAMNMYQAIAEASHRLKNVLMRYKNRHMDGFRRSKVREKYRWRWLAGEVNL